MSESIDDERERIRERKLRELQARLEDGSDSGTVNADPRGTRTGSGTSPNEPIPIDGSDHFESVVETHEVVLVDCYADWCGPCQMLEPTIDALAAETDAAVAKLDVDAHPDVAGQLGAMSIPTLVLYAGGEPVERLVGMQDRATLQGLIERHG